MAKHVRDVLAFVEHAKHNLKAGHVPHEELIVRQKLSRGLEGYKSPSPAARAALQLQAIGRQIAPGQSVQFLFTRGGCGVHAWELEDALDYRRLDTKRYCTLLDRAIRTVLDPCKSQFTEKQLL